MRAPHQLMIVTVYLVIQHNSPWVETIYYWSSGVLESAASVVGEARVVTLFYVYSFYLLIYLVHKNCSSNNMLQYMIVLGLKEQKALT